jgi:hypothetical protein
VSGLEFVQYISKDALILIPALWICGNVLKKTNLIIDNAIPAILIVLGVLGAVGLIGINAGAVIQGVLVGGASIGLHQVKKQIEKH